jgi:transposase
MPALALMAADAQPGVVPWADLREVSAEEAADSDEQVEYSFLVFAVSTVRDRKRGSSVPAIPAWLIEPLWVQFSALLPERPTFDPAHPLGVHRRRLDDRIVFDKLIQVLRFGCSYEAIADTTCSATTIRNRRDEWIKAGLFAQLKHIALDCYDRIVGLILEEISVDGCITKAPGGGEVAGRSPVAANRG